MVKKIDLILEDFFNKEDSRFILYKNWHEVVGDLATKVSIEKVVQDTLFISVSELHWMHELYALSEIIIERANDLIKKYSKNDRETLFKDLKLKYKQKKDSRINPGKKIPIKVSRDFVINKKQEEALKNIQDSELRLCLKKYLISVLEKV